MGTHRNYLIAAAVLGPTSVACLQVAVRRTNLAEAVAITLIGGLIGSVALLAVNEVLVEHVRRPQHRTLWRWAGPAAIALGAAGALVALTAENGVAVAAMFVVAMLGVLVVNLTLSDDAVLRPSLWVATGLIVAAGSVVPVTLGGPAMRLAGLTTYVVGLVAFKLGLPPLIHAERQQQRAVGTIVAATIAAVLSAGLFAAGGRMGAVGALVLIGALSAAGHAGLCAESTQRRWIAVLITGLTLLVVGYFAAGRVLGEWWLLIAVVCSLLAALGAWFVFRGEGIGFLVLLGFVLVWVVHDRSGAYPESFDPATTPQLLALGDSFMSGEGAFTFLEPTNTVGSDGNTCRRAPSSYAALVSERLDHGLIDVSCSGATIANIAESGQKAPVPVNNADPPVAGHLPQLDNIDPDNVASIDVVLISIGGNDSGFSTVIQACLLPSGCDNERDAWLAKAASLGPRLEAVYGEVRDRFRHATVVVMPYPRFVDQTECGLAVSARELSFVSDFITTLNDTVSIAAQRSGVRVYPYADSVFDDHRLCDRGREGANFVSLAPPRGSLAARLDPATWIHGTMHPRPLGHQLIADSLVAMAPDRGGWLHDTLAAVADGTEPVNPAPAAIEPGPLPDPDDVARADDLLDDRTWLSDQLVTTSRAVAVPAALLVLGGMLAALGATRLNLPFIRFLAARHPPRQ